MVVREDYLHHKEKVEDTLLEKDDVPRFRARAIEILRNAAVDGRLFECTDLSYFLYRWKELCGSDEVRIWTSHLLESPEKALKLLEILATPVHVYAGNGSREKFMLQAKSLEDIVSLELLDSQIGRISSRLSSHQEKLMKALKIALSQKAKSAPYEQIDEDELDRFG